MRQSPARPARLLTLGLIGAAGSWAVLVAWIRAGEHPPPVPWSVAGVLAVAAGVLLVAGWQVRRWVRQGQQLAAGTPVQRRELDPLTAARTFTLAVASAHAGAILAGWYTGQSLAEFADVPAGRGGRLLWTLAAAGVSLLLSLSGLLVQRWCRVPPDEPGGMGEGGQTAATDPPSTR
ncbi:MAG: DUF3180 domain-containing protein [Kineosporiaceae bacterium]